MSQKTTSHVLLLLLLQRKSQTAPTSNESCIITHVSGLHAQPYYHYLVCRSRYGCARLTYVTSEYRLQSTTCFGPPVGCEIGIRNWRRRGWDHECMGVACHQFHFQAPRLAWSHSAFIIMQDDVTPLPEIPLYFRHHRSTLVFWFLVVPELRGCIAIPSNFILEKCECSPQYALNPTKRCHARTKMCLLPARRV